MTNWEILSTLHEYDGVQGELEAATEYNELDGFLQH